MKRALIVKASSLGDIIHCFPVAELLAERGYTVDWVVERPFSELVQAHPLVDTVHIVDTKAWRRAPLSSASWQAIRTMRQRLRATRYDVVFDLQGNLKSGLITACCRADAKVGFAWGCVPEWPNILATRQRYTPKTGGNIRDDYLSIVRQYLGIAPGEPTLGGVSVSDCAGIRLVTEQADSDVCEQIIGSDVLLCPGSAWPNKQMTEAALGDFVDLLAAEMGDTVWVAWGSASEQALAEALAARAPDQVRALPRLPLPQLQNVMDSVRFVIAMDSLPLHLAGTTSTPTFSVFGASSMVKYIPLGEHHRGLQGECPYGITFEKRCDQLRTCKTGACIRTLTAEQVMGALLQHPAW